VKLHEAESPNAKRVHVFMAEKGIDLPRVIVDIRGGENLTPEFLAKNPIGRVPVLELDDGSFLSESPERAPWGLLVRMTSIGGAENAACSSYSPGDVDLAVKERKPHDGDVGEPVLVEVGHREEWMGDRVVESPRDEIRGVVVEVNRFRPDRLASVVQRCELLGREVPQDAVQIDLLLGVRHR
jgi:Glutathione S-transferase, N-terminal domain